MWWGCASTTYSHEKSKSMSEYPKCKYHAVEPTVIVLDIEQELALSDDWYDTPTALAASEAQKKAPKKGK